MDKRQIILSASLDLFTRQGFQETTTAQISKVAGVATGTLFNYFDSKESLIHELYLYCKASMVKTLSSTVDDSMSLDARFRQLWKNTLLWGMNNSRKFLFFQQFSHSPYVPRLTRKEETPQFGFLLELIQDGIDKGIFKQLPLEIHHSAILNLATGFISELLQSDKTQSIESFTEATFSILWDALTVRTN